MTGNHSEQYSTGMSQDFAVSSTTPWNWALQLAPSKRSGGLSYKAPSSQETQWGMHKPQFGSVSVGVSTGHIVAKGRQVKDWGDRSHWKVPGQLEHTGRSAALAGLCWQRVRRRAGGGARTLREHAAADGDAAVVRGGSRHRRINKD